MGLELADIDARKARGIVEIEVIAVGRDLAWYTRLLNIRGLRRAWIASFAEFLEILAGMLSFSMGSTTGQRFYLSTSCPRERLRIIS
jgi:hypothetical protein